MPTVQILLGGWNGSTIAIGPVTFEVKFCRPDYPLPVAPWLAALAEAWPVLLPTDASTEYQGVDINRYAITFSQPWTRYQQEHFAPGQLKSCINTRG
jgi:hypothetical protein